MQLMHPKIVSSNSWCVCAIVHTEFVFHRLHLPSLLPLRTCTRAIHMYNVHRARAKWLGIVWKCRTICWHLIVMVRFSLQWYLALTCIRYTSEHGTSNVLRFLALGCAKLCSYVSTDVSDHFQELRTRARSQNLNKTTLWDLVVCFRFERQTNYVRHMHSQSSNFCLMGLENRHT